MDKFFAQQAKKAAQSRPPQPEQEQENAAVAHSSGTSTGTATEAKKIPKGVVLGKDGKPCRTCTSIAEWAALTKKSTSPSISSTTTSTTSLPTDCPPDVDTLGNHTWTLLHSISASYPIRAPPQRQSEMRQFLGLFAKLYPCWVCADDFKAWMERKGNEPRVEGREGLGRWMCEAHNEVNRKLGKGEFDCARWEERWRTGWKDGRCD